MKRTWKPAALALLAALGFAVSAHARPQRSRPPATTTTTTAPAATATVAAPAVTITGPPAGSFYTRGSTVLVGARVTAPPGSAVTCTVDWGDGTAPSGPTAATETSPGVYACCPVGHVYVTAGAFAIRVAATVNGAPAGAASVVVTVV